MKTDLVTGDVRVLVDHQFQLGENPLWDEVRRKLFWTDIDAGELWWADADGGNATRFYTGPKVGGFTLEASGRLALFRETDIAIIDPESPKDVRSIASFDEPNAERFNDVLALADGTVFAGTIAARDGSGGVYHVSRDLLIRERFLGTDVSNGMALPSAGALIWTCSTRNRLISCAHNTDTHELTPESTLYQASDEEGTPDGLALDAEGRLWSARWEGHRVVVHDPDGQPTGMVEVPTSRVTSVCFGGLDLKTLYITTSEGPVYAVETLTSGRVENRSRLEG